MNPSDSRADRALDDLRALLRIPSINPPGGEGPAIDLIAERLGEAGVTFERLDSGDRPNLVARIPGDGSAGGPLLLSGHVDVVPVERDRWSHDPFAGEIHGGYLFGRGAIDMKNMVAMCLHVVCALAESGKKPNRDVIFAAVSDEEQGCAHGSRFLVENHPDAVRAEYMLGEVGGFSLDISGVRYYPIQVAEKGTVRLRLTVRGRPGHGSVPHGEMAVVRLGALLTKLGKTRLPMHPVASVQEFVRGLASAQKGAAKLVLPLLLKPAFAGFVMDKLLPDKSTAETFAANLSNTVSPTILEASDAVNVIPGHASVVLDGRILPGQSADDLVRELRAVVGDGVEIDVLSSHPGRENTPGGPLFDAICENVRRHDPAGVPVPYMVTGFTDAAYFGLLGAQCYGYSPLRFPAEDHVSFKELFHGHDERIHVDGFRWGYGCLWDLVSRFVGVAG